MVGSIPVATALCGCEFVAPYTFVGNLATTSSDAPDILTVEPHARMPPVTEAQASLKAMESRCECR